MLTESVSVEVERPGTQGIGDDAGGPKLGFGVGLVGELRLWSFSSFATGTDGLLVVSSIFLDTRDRHATGWKRGIGGVRRWTVLG